MHKLFIIIVGISLAAALFIGITFYNKTRQDATLSTENALESTEELEKPAETKYDDPAGFSFSYPDNLLIEESDIKDSALYSHLVITSEKHKGTIEIKVMDSNFSTTSAWLKKQSEEQKKLPSVPIKLADIEGTEYESETTIRAVAIDSDKILYDIQTMFNGDKDFWLSVHRKIVNTFVFAEPELVVSGNEESTSVEDTSYEEEEIIE